MKKPILLLDVDGVFNVIGKKMVPRKIYIPVQIRGETFQKQFFPVPLTRPVLVWAWRHFEVYWLTAWREMANGIAIWAGLPEIPVLVDPVARLRKLYEEASKKKGKEAQAEAYCRIDWKAEVVKERFRSERRKILWLEDGISQSAKQWIAGRSRVRYFGTDSFVGVTRRHVRQMAAYAGVDDSLSSLRHVVVEGRR